MTVLRVAPHQLLLHCLAVGAMTTLAGFACGGVRELDGDASGVVSAGASDGVKPEQSGQSEQTGSNDSDNDTSTQDQESEQTPAESSSASDDDDDGDSDDDSWIPKFDVGVVDQLDPDVEDFSYIWIANTNEGTLSKIDTRTAIEVSRFRTGPAATDLQPSRTAVNLQGDAVVANRGSGTVVKFAARPAACVDRNGDGVIQTSSGASDLLAWGQDECMLWSQNPGFTGGAGGSRGLAWDFATDANGEDAPRVWVGFRNDPAQGHVVRLDGATGAIDADVALPGWSEIHGQGVYGGAIAPDGDFWAIGKGGSVLHVDAQTLVERRWHFDPPGGAWQETFYGMTVDGEANLWVGGQSGDLYRFDTVTETIERLASVGPQRLYGITIDADRGIAYVAAQAPCELKRFDIVTGAFIAGVPLAGCVTPVGTSIDFDGMAWVVDKDAHRAYRVDPDSLVVTQVGGLVTPYTYSDMTGGALKGVIPPGRAR